MRLHTREDFRVASNDIFCTCVHLFTTFTTSTSTPPTTLNSTANMHQKYSDSQFAAGAPPMRKVADIVPRTHAQASHPPRTDRNSSPESLPVFHANSTPKAANTNPYGHVQSSRLGKSISYTVSEPLPVFDALPTQQPGVSELASFPAIGTAEFEAQVDHDPDSQLAQPVDPAGMREHGRSHSRPFFGNLSLSEGQGPRNHHPLPASFSQESGHPTSFHEGYVTKASANLRDILDNDVDMPDMFANTSSPSYARMMDQAMLALDDMVSGNMPLDPKTVTWLGLASQTNHPTPPQPEYQPGSLRDDGAEETFNQAGSSTKTTSPISSSNNRSADQAGIRELLMFSPIPSDDEDDATINSADDASNSDYDFTPFGEDPMASNRVVEPQHHSSIANVSQPARAAARGKSTRRTKPGKVKPRKTRASGRKRAANAYGYASDLKNRPRASARAPRGIPISLIEICTFFPSWFQHPQALVRALKAGWGRQPLAGAQLHATNDLDSDRLFHMESRIQKQVGTAGRTVLGLGPKDKFSIDLLSGMPLDDDLTADNWQLRSSVKRETDVALIDVADPVFNGGNWPQGEDRLVITRCLEWAIAHPDQNYTTADWNRVIRDANIPIPTGLDSSHDVEALERLCASVVIP